MTQATRRRPRPLAVAWRALSVLVHEGPASFVMKALGETVFRRALLVERSLVGDLPEVRPWLPVTFAVLTEGDAGAYAAFRPETPAAEVLARLRRGHYCFVTWYEGRIVNAWWAGVGHVSIDYLQWPFTLPADVAFGYESYTLPAFRHLGLATSNRTFAMRYLRDLGFRRLLSILVPENRAAFGPPSRLGYSVVGTLGYVGLGKWKRHFARYHRRPLLQPRSTSASSTYWDRVAGAFKRRRHYLDDFLAGQKRQAHLTLLCDWAGDPAGKTVLKTDLFEEAFGSDGLLEAIAAAGAYPLGIDVSPAVAAEAKRRAAPAACGLVVADVRALPFAPGSVDIVVSPSTLDHFPSHGGIAQALSAIADVLRPGGVLVVTLDNPRNVTYPLLRLADRLGFTPYRLGATCTEGELELALAGVGLKATDSRTIIHAPRLLPTGLTALARVTRCSFIARFNVWFFERLSRLEGSSLQHLTACFVAVRAVKLAERTHLRVAEESDSS